MDNIIKDIKSVDKVVLLELNEQELSNKVDSIFNLIYMKDKLEERFKDNILIELAANIVTNVYLKDNDVADTCILSFNIGDTKVEVNIGKLPDTTGVIYKTEYVV